MNIIQSKSIKAMKTQHTQGEWNVESNTETNPLKYIITNRTNADITDTKAYLEEVEANRRLIASAPELLEMVYRLMQCVKRLSEDGMSQEDRDKEAQWIGEAHELLYKINPNYNK